MLVNKHKYKDAIPTCNEYLKLHPQNIEVYNILYISLKGLKDYKLARIVCQIALLREKEERRKKRWLNRLPYIRRLEKRQNVDKSL